MIILSEEEISNGYHMRDAIRDLKAGLLSKQEGSIVGPQRTVIDVPQAEASSIYMPAADLKKAMAAVKVVSIFPHNPKQGKSTTQGMLVLTELKTGKHIAVMDASYLTRVRTGALTGIATDKLSRTDSKVLGVIGTGGMAFDQVLAVLEVREIEQIKLYNRTAEKAESFKGKLADLGLNTDIEVVHTSDEAVRDADIICCATRSNEPVFDGKLLKAGTHINGVGSYLPSMREVDETTIKRADKIVVDDLNGVKEEAGELIHAEKHSDWSFSDVYGELFEIANKEGLVRESDEEITFFKSVGAAYFDLSACIGVYEKFKS